MAFHGWPLRGPSQENITPPVHDINSFQNTIPTSSEKPHSLPLTRPARQWTDAFSPAAAVRKDSKFRTVFWPAIAITVPIALLSATLMILVFAYRITSEPSIFRDGNGEQDPQGKHNAYILVNFSATRLVFAASFLSTVAPLLGSFIMTLWSLIASAGMREASSQSLFGQLPTPYQLSLLVGVCLSSVSQLKSYFWYTVSRNRRTHLPPVLNRAAGIFTLSILLACGVFISDTTLHYLTSTIVFDHITKTPLPERTSGYGLSSMCLDLDRVGSNGGFPCSMNVGLDFEDPDRTARRNEMARLQSNSSATSQIRVTGVDAAEDESVVIVIPHPKTLAESDDYRASTIGVGATCRLVPPTDCGMRYFGQDDIYTQFNCSENFYGVLGKSPNISSGNGEIATDPDLSPLGFKPATNLQWAFFTNPSLTTLWNPESFDPATNQPDMERIVPDDELINPFYLGTAARVTTNSFTATSNIVTTQQNIFNTSFNGYVDLIMSCSVTSYSVNYTWYKSAIQNVTVEPSENGTILEIFKGSQFYNLGLGSGYDLQQYLTSAAIAGNDTASFLTTWGNSYAVKVMSLVGAYLTPRTNLEEQDRESLLVAKVPKAALGALIACSLIYTVMGVVLCIAAYRASSDKVSLIAEQLSLAGLTNMAFGHNTSESPSTTLTPGSSNDSRSKLNADDYFTRLPRRESRRVRISGTDFRVWV